MEGLREWKVVGLRLLRRRIRWVINGQRVCLTPGQTLRCSTADTSHTHCIDFQAQYPPNSQPTDITLSQFLSIQEKGVSAWSFEPDYESTPSLLVHARTELTFLPDPTSASSVQSNLPLPKLNEVYYWEVKMFDLPEGTNVAVGLSTKPYPSFRLPGWSRFSIAYHANGDKSHNYPFTSTSFGPSLKEGDVLGVGYRPRSGTVFYTRNGRRLDDAFVGLGRWNLFPTVGADGPCSVHVNLGQSGFVFIEANVKKWGLAPSVGTLAPPPAYGSERGSILLEAGGTPRDPSILSTPTALSESLGTSGSPLNPRQRSPRIPRRTRGAGAVGLALPAQSSPLRGTPITSSLATSHIEELSDESDQLMTPERYISPTDAQYHTPPRIHADFVETEEGDGDDDQWQTDSNSTRSGGSTSAPHPPQIVTVADQPNVQSPDSPQQTLNPPTPHATDIYLQPLQQRPRQPQPQSPPPRVPPAHEPPAYSPLDAYRYADGVALDLPAEVIAAALEGTSRTRTNTGQSDSSRR